MYADGIHLHAADRVGSLSHGFSLEEVATLLELEDGTDRRSIRRIAGARLEETRKRIADLQRIERALYHLLHDCEAHARAHRCPIIAAIAAPSDIAAGERRQPIAPGRQGQGLPRCRH